jgi:hypothetical protein
MEFKPHILYQPSSPIGIIMTEQFKIKATPSKIQNNFKIFVKKYIFNTLKNMHITVEEGNFELEG